MKEPGLERELDSLRETYNAPPEPPTDLMWARIQRRRGVKTASSTRWWGWAAAAAAILIIGVGIGRMSVTAPPEEQVAETPTVQDRERSALLQFAARDFLARTDARLTQFQVEPSSTPIDVWAGALLSQTRLFLDTPLAEDPELHMLLLDLEFVFAQIAEAAGTGDQQRRDRIVENLANDDLMLRVRSSNPAETTRGFAQEGRL